ncbi:MAG: DNA-3-methyladenine glycosylase 2 family protein [Actinomycetales bacterium]|nr:DNA-3-methyladenine glycosylase 2 family protein [Actinomycetales bacterium]
MARASVRSAARTWRPGWAVDVRATLSSLVRGGTDPCHRVQDDGTFWRATTTPDGPVLLRLLACPATGEVEAEAWGPGTDWALAGVPELLGSADRPEEFRPAPEHPRLVAAARARPGFRVPRTRAVFEALAAAALEQRVTGEEAHRAWRMLVSRYGQPAPGPSSVPGGLRVPPSPRDWASIPSWVWTRAGVDETRRRVVLAGAVVAGRLENTLDLDPVEVARRLRTLPGVGVWTAAEVRQRAHGDADAFSWADYHAAGDVSWALTGVVMDDEGCARVVERYRGHRYRVQRLLELDHAHRPRRGPRRSLPTHV